MEAMGTTASFGDSLVCDIHPIRSPFLPFHLFCFPSLFSRVHFAVFFLPPPIFLPSSQLYIDLLYGTYKVQYVYSVTMVSRTHRRPVSIVRQSIAPINQPDRYLRYCTCVR